jgi:hypothetical protein
MSNWRLVFGIASVLLLAPVRTQTADHILIAPGSGWKYNDSGSNLGTSWRNVSFSDADWPSGMAQLGYGDGGEATVISYGSSTSNRRITYYFRRSFDVLNPDAFDALSVRFVRDDGCVIYLNGVEVARSNMPPGAISHTTLATTAIGGADESAWIEAPVDRSLLVAGANVLAVEIHQQSPSSSDVSFDLELRGVEAVVPPPVVTLTAPGPGALTNVSNVTFAASVSSPVGLASASLYLSGPPQTLVLSGPSQLHDAQISADSPSTPGGLALSLNVDGLTPHAHALLKFPNLIGPGAQQVPAGAVITSANLLVNCTDPGNAIRMYRLTQDWVEDQATWTTRMSGASWGSAGADGAGSHAGAAVTGNCTSIGQTQIDLTRFVQEWSDGVVNYGLVMTDSGTDGIDFSSSESSASPTLTITYRPAQVPVATHVLSGNTADVSFAGTVALGQTYFWNVQAIDTSGRQSWAAADFQLTADAGAPDEPALLWPLDGAAGVDTPTPLMAQVSDPNGGSLHVTFELRRAAAPEFTIVVMPDTQFYSQSFPAIFTAQTQWIVDNKDVRNIVFVTHEGDIVQNAGVESEWIRANQSLSLLDGVVPYGMGPGNHDQPTTFYNQYFPFTRYQGRPWYGGHYQNTNDNNYQLFSGGGLDFVIVHLEYCPPAGAVAWASSVFASYPDRIGIMTTHAYLNESAQRSTHGCTNTQYLWDGLAVPNPNLHFMLSGHVHDESRRADVVNGHPVFQMLADYQSRPSGGEGWLRLLRFAPADNRIYVRTFSPWLNRYETDANSEFTLEFPMAAGFASAGTATVPSGSQAVVTPPALDPNTRYEWRATVTNSSGRSRSGPVWTFTTDAGGTINLPPTAVSDAYTMQAGGTLTVSAPGVLANDTDVDGPGMAASLVSVPTSGALTLAANGSFTYTPAAGFAGSDSFTYRASDGSLTSAAATVALTVQPATPPPPVIVLTANFNSGQNSFTYSDNVFRGATQSSYASGSRISSGGFTGGALRVQLGGINSSTITNMSGGWRRTFTLSAPAAVSLSFRYNLDQGADYESDEISQMLASVDGLLRGVFPGVYVAQVAGNGNGGSAVGTGWRLFETSLGTLPAGTHTLILGGYNNKKNGSSERTTILIDDVSVTVP